jgi:hypothetical protein
MLAAYGDSQPRAELVFIFQPDSSLSYHDTRRRTRRIFSTDRRILSADLRSLRHTC